MLWDTIHRLITFVHMSTIWRDIVLDPSWLSVFYPLWWSLFIRNHCNGPIFSEEKRKWALWWTLWVQHLCIITYSCQTYISFTQQLEPCSLSCRLFGFVNVNRFSGFQTPGCMQWILWHPSSHDHTTDRLPGPLYTLFLLHVTHIILHAENKHLLLNVWMTQDGVFWL